MYTGITIAQERLLLLQGKKPQTSLLKPVQKCIAALSLSIIQSTSTIDSFPTTKSLQIVWPQFHLNLASKTARCLSEIYTSSSI